MEDPFEVILLSSDVDTMTEDGAPALLHVSAAGHSVASGVDQLLNKLYIGALSISTQVSVNKLLEEVFKQSLGCALSIVRQTTLELADGSCCVFDLLSSDAACASTYRGSAAQKTESPLLLVLRCPKSVRAVFHESLLLATVKAAILDVLPTNTSSFCGLNTNASIDFLRGSSTAGSVGSPRRGQSVAAASQGSVWLPGMQRMHLHSVLAAEHDTPHIKRIVFQVLSSVLASARQISVVPLETSRESTTIFWRNIRSCVSIMQPSFATVGLEQADELAFEVECCVRELFNVTQDQFNSPVAVSFHGEPNRYVLETVTAWDNGALLTGLDPVLIRSLAPYVMLFASSVASLADDGATTTESIRRGAVRLFIYGDSVALDNEECTSPSGLYASSGGTTAPLVAVCCKGSCIVAVTLAPCCAPFVGTPLSAIPGKLLDGVAALASRKGGIVVPSPWPTDPTTAAMFFALNQNARSVVNGVAMPATLWFEVLRLYRSDGHCVKSECLGSYQSATLTDVRQLSKQPFAATFLRHTTALWAPLCHCVKRVSLLSPLGRIQGSFAAESTVINHVETQHPSGEMVVALVFCGVLAGVGDSNSSTAESASVGTSELRHWTAFLTSRFVNTP